MSTLVAKNKADREAVKGQYPQLQPSRQIAGDATLASQRDVYQRLRSTDWTFAAASTRGETHALHPYPAKFIPQIPRALIAALYPGDGTGILDPFCGSGTTLVEAAKVGAPAIGIDLSPLACLISKVKVTPLRAGMGDAAALLARRAKLAVTPTPPIPAVDHWFEREVQGALASLVAQINKEQDRGWQDALRVALSSIIVRVSNQDSDTRYAAVQKNVSAANVYDWFVAAVWSVERAIKSTWEGNERKPTVNVLQQDVLNVRPETIGQAISLVITSPPYPNAYEYWLYHKYRMFWLGMDPISMRKQEIGARPHYFKRNPQTAADFERQMATVFTLLSRVMVRGGHACFQIGDSVIRGEPVDNTSLLSRVAKQAGFDLVASMPRQIPGHRKAFNLHHARISHENILVFRSEALCKPHCWNGTTTDTFPTNAISPG